jgi:hypothetical protein
MPIRKTGHPESIRLFIIYILKNPDAGAAA